MAEREITITIKGKNLTGPEFDKARKELAGLKGDTEKAGAGAGSLGSAFSKAGAGLAVAATAGAAVAAAMALAAKEIMDLGVRGSTVGDVAAQFDVMNRSIGNNATTLKSTLRSAFAGTINDFDAMQAVNKGLSQGLQLSADQFGMTAKASRVLADRVGGDTKDAFDQLTMAMASGKDVALKNIGLNIDGEAAVERFAQALGKEKGALTEAEQKTAKKNAILEEMQRVLAESGEAEVDFADRVDQAKVMLANFTDEVAVGIANSPVLAAGMDSIGAAFKHAFGAEQGRLVDLLVAGVNKFAMFLVDAGIYAVEFGKVGVQAFGLVMTPIGYLQLGVAQLTTRVVGFIEALGAAGSYLPGVGDKFAALRTVAAGMGEQLRTDQTSIQGYISKTMEMATGQGAVIDKLSGVGNALITARGEMEAAALGQGTFRKETDASTTALNTHRGAQQQHIALSKEEQKAINDKASAAAKFAESVRRFGSTAAEYLVPFKAAVREVENILEKLPSSAAIATNGLAPFKAGLKDTGTAANSMAASLREGLSGIMQTIPGTLARAFEGGGNWLGAAKSVGSQFGSTIGKTIGESFSSLGKLGGPLGEALGSLVGPLIGKIGSLFTDKNKQQVQQYNGEIKKVQDALLKQYGTMGDLEAAATRVGLSFQENWGHKGKAGLEATNKLAEQLEQRLKAVELANTNAINGFGAVMAGMAKPWIALGGEIDKAFKKTGEAEAAYKKALVDPKVSADQLAQLQKAFYDAADAEQVFYRRLGDDRAVHKQQLADLGVQAIGTFGAAMVAGKSYGEAMAAVGPSIATLGQSYKILGVNVEDVGLKHLMVQSTVAKGNPELIAATSGLGSSMQGLAQLGMLNVDTFGAMQRTGMAMYQRLQGEVGNLGGDSRDALMPMQGYLQQAAAQAELLGIPLDANTQMLIGQSKELGLWKTVGKTAQDLLIDGMKTMVDKVDQLLSKMLGFSGAITNLPAKKDVEINVTTNERVNRTIRELVDVDGMDWGGPQASGGDYWVTRPTLFLAGEAGPERATFTPKGQNGSFTGPEPGASPITLNVFVDKEGSANILSGPDFRRAVQAAVDSGDIRIQQRHISSRGR